MEKDIKAMSKKELKDYINTNGFFFHIQCDKIETDAIEGVLTDAMAQNMVKTGREVPQGDNIVVFKGIASQNYSGGEKSRNGYKYDQNGWDFSSYLNNPIILWQHETCYGGIGNAISFWNDKAGNLNAMFFVDLDTLEERNAVQVKRGYVTAISTGAIAKEYMFEDNDTGERYSEADAEEKFGWENVWEACMGMGEILTLVVTKAEMIENSLVTIGSNQNAIAMQNGIGNHFKNYGETYRKNKVQIDTVEVEETPTAEVPPETQEAPIEPTETVTTAEVPPKESSTQDTPTTETTEVEAVTPPETETPVEQTAGETEEESQPVSENDTKLADALEQIAKLVDTVAKQDEENKAQKVAFDTFKDEVYDTMQDFIKSHNDAIDNLQQVNTALGSIRVSKGLPHVRSETIDKQNNSPIGGLVRQLKGL